MGSYPLSSARMRESDDVDLLARIRRGDRAAFESLVRKYIDRITGVAARALHDRHEALDVAQEVFTLAWTALQAWKPGGQVFSWLYRTTLNLVSHRRRPIQRKGPAH
jgi:RNA polymerase sigma-70 factor, ECF subfamily